MMQAIVHIGIEKTGTTSIQSFMTLNRQALAQGLVCYPSTPGQSNHMKLGAFATNDDKRDDLRARYKLFTKGDIEQFRGSFVRELRDEVLSAGCPTVVFSNEHCSSRLIEDAEIERFRDMLLGLFDSVRIVVYLRRQDEAALSHYATKVKAGHTRPIALPDEEERRERYDYASLLSRWSKVFGRSQLTVRLYDKAHLVDGDAVADFMATISLPPNPGYEMPKRENESMDAVSLEWLRRMNRHIPYVKGGEIFALRGNLVQLVEQNADGPRLALDADKLASFMELFSESNARVAETYFGGPVHACGDPLFGSPVRAVVDAPRPEMTLDDAFQKMAQIWLMKQQQADDLNARLAKRLRDDKR